MPADLSTNDPPVFIWRFANAEFNEATWELRVAGAPIEMEPRPLEVLLLLLRHAGEVVSREELLEAVYGHQHIGVGALSNAVGKLRRALDDEAQAIVATVHRVGYRLLAPVTRTPAGTGRAPLQLKAGQAVNGREHWELLRPLGANRDTEVWLARHARSADQHVFKFSLEGLHVSALKREVTLYRVIRQTLGERPDFVSILDWNFSAPPYFIECEYGGVNLADWAGAKGPGHAVPLAQRLELFAGIAEAIGAAHAAGVLHKDLKPANVLVYADADGCWRPRLTDFGSGRLLEPGRVAELGITRLGFTQTQSVAAESNTGTPLYLAPEVINGQPPTALSDIYALGVMLYQLVVGDLRRPLAPGWEHDIADEVLRGDIGAAAAGNPSRRLASGLELAARLRGLERRRAALAQEREDALRAAALQQSLDRARAKRPLLVTAALALVAGLALSLWFYRDAVRARDEARTQAAIAEGVSRFLSHDVLGGNSSYDPAVKNSVTVLQALDRAAASLDRGPQAPPLTEATIRASLAWVYTQMSKNAAAVTQAQAAADLYRAHLGPADPRTLQAEQLWAANLVWDSRFAEADALLDRIGAVLAADSRIDPETRLVQDVRRGANYFYWERYAQALPYYEKALDEHETLHPGDYTGLATRREMLALTYTRLGRFDDANRQFRAEQDELHRSADPGLALSLALADEAMGISLYLQQRYADAGQALGRARPVLVKELGANQEESAESLEYLGLVYLATGSAGQAEATCRAAYQSYLERYGEHHLYALTALGHLGAAELAAGAVPPGLRDVGRATAGLGALLGEAAPQVQYFKFIAAQQQAGTPAAAPLLASLDPAALQLAMPAQDWRAVLQELKARSVVAGAPAS
jgi:non-specific serine/threonine protein kinase